MDNIDLARFWAYLKKFVTFSSQKKKNSKSLNFVSNFSKKFLFYLFLNIFVNIFSEMRKKPSSDSPTRFWIRNVSTCSLYHAFLEWSGGVFSMKHDLCNKQQKNNYFFRQFYKRENIVRV